PALWRQLFFVSVALVALVFIVILQRKLSKESVFYTVSFGLIAGGAIGNLIDRVRLGFVIDFLDVYIGARHWPAFNVADSAITVGIGIFLVINFFDSRKAGQGIET
ncbi:MAG: signal peptidase II, partial [Desulfobulbaceae bacterium]|nr:signal peptidase II [Desulfobulbaceae bacterium]